MIGFLARVSPEKGLQNLVTAFDLLMKRTDVPPCRLQVAGYLGAHRQEFLEEQRQRAVQAGWGDKFAYVGEPDHAGKVAFLQGLDIFSVPTDYVEPKGLYVLEAMACGAPVIASCAGALPEVVGDAGLFFQPTDASALTICLRQLLDNLSLGQALGCKGMRRAQQFSWARSAQAALTVFETTRGKKDYATDVASKWQ